LDITALNATLAVRMTTFRIAYLSLKEKLSFEKDFATRHSLPDAACLSKDRDNGAVMKEESKITVMFDKQQYITTRMLEKSIWFS
jgi:hypothetical protein